MSTLDPSIELRLLQLIAAHHELDALDVLPHVGGFALEVRGAPKGAGHVVAANRGDRGGMDWSYRGGREDFGFGIGESTHKSLQEKLEVLNRLREFASTGRVTH
jgi:hypothetical protein